MENNSKNSWTVEMIKELEKENFHGKIICNFSDGQIPSIEIHKRINRPTEIKKEYSSLK